MVSALFLDVLANRKQVWVMIGLAAGLALLQKRAGRTDAAIEDGASRVYVDGRA
jgi:hypothetical protein